MEFQNLFLIGTAFLVIAADVALRLFLAPERKDRSVSDLLSFIQDGRDARPDNSPSPVCVANGNLDSVSESLLRYFELSGASRKVVQAVSQYPEGVVPKEIEFQLAEETSRVGKPPLPSTAIRKVTMNLVRADFICLQEGRLRVTERGLALNGLLHLRRQS
ncbi:MAG: hypothetical protein ACO1QB_15300 [Verrucomicrobiales bacterium]